MGVSKDLNIIWGGIMRWQRRKLMIYFCRVLRWILSVYRSVDTSLGLKQLKRTDVWHRGSHTVRGADIRGGEWRVVGVGDIQVEGTLCRERMGLVGER